MIIRKANFDDIPCIAQVNVDSWRSAYKGIVPDDFLSDLSYEKQEMKWEKRIQNKQCGIYVAENSSGQIIGYANNGPERSGNPFYDSELYAIYILKEYQRQGVKRLIQQMVKEGMSSFLVWVLAKNPSRRFYEKLGGKKLGTQYIEIGNVNLEEVAYGVDSNHFRQKEPAPLY
ncbi:acetyltransferase [Kroppenstedtia guangzhouensis]|uniref:Acetyltransferase n=1 Tax=Kroppenstedtia guangzhouensis TaxID=1274356 RepID=A0ABQ1H4T3_9BACL|nr:GNAT family N-acetyltransferase [Kroppenstedtia guangzhouensis]GGA58763.1 acetyltransferase [Kroppenstedtia guangzhouensis]